MRIACGILALLLTGMVGCGAPESDNPDDPLLARVHQRELRLSEMEGMFPDNASAADSSSSVSCLLMAFSASGRFSVM